MYRTEGKTAAFITGAESFYLVASEVITHDAKPILGDYDFVDTMDDVTLVTKSVFAEVTKNHQSAISWSQADRPSYFLLENIRQIFRDDKDKITGMFDDGNGILIFKENSIIKLYHTGASQNWYIRKIWTEFGCDEPKSMVKSGNTIYFRYQKKPYAFVSDSAPQYIGFGKQNTLDNMTVIDSASNDEWVMFACTQSTNHFIIVYDKKIQTWYQFNFDTSDLTAILVKKYNDFWITNNIYAAFAKRIYDYDKSSIDDDVSGGSQNIQAVIKFPRIQVDGTTKAKLRDMVLAFDRQGAVPVGLILTRDTGTDSSVNIPSGDGIIRITGFSGKPASDFFDIKLTDGMDRIDSFRVDLRLVKRGVGG